MTFEYPCVLEAPTLYKRTDEIVRHEKVRADRSGGGYKIIGREQRVKETQVQ